MEKITYDDGKDYLETLQEMVNKINEIIDWINSQ